MLIATWFGADKQDGVTPPSRVYRRPGLWSLPTPGRKNGSKGAVRTNGSNGTSRVAGSNGISPLNGASRFNGSNGTLHVNGGFANGRILNADLTPLHAVTPRELADPWARRTRRALNVVVALVALVITAPLMLLLAILVKATSRGPVFFTQTRVGLDRRGQRPDENGKYPRKQDIGGRPFRIYKFRTMSHCPNGTREREQVWAQPDDPRVTPLGRFMRKFRLDEVPQFFNVLRGDMNIVGPRPEQPEIFQGLRKEIDGYQRRQRVLPGITGLAQVTHHYDRSVDDVKRKVLLDLEYVRSVSAAEDLRIMAQTLPVILFRKGAW